MDRINNKLPNDPTAIVLTIVSLILLILGCCCGLFAIVSLVLSIIGLVMAKNAMAEYRRAPENYDPKSYKTMDTAKILGVIGIALSGLLLLSQMWFWFIAGDAISRSLWDEMGENGSFHREWNWSSGDFEAETDSITDNPSNMILKKQGDSIVLDSITTKIQQ